MKTFHRPSFDIPQSNGVYSTSRFGGGKLRNDRELLIKSLIFSLSSLPRNAPKDHTIENKYVRDKKSLVNLYKKKNYKFLYYKFLYNILFKLVSRYNKLLNRGSRSDFLFAFMLFQVFRLFI